MAGTSTEVPARHGIRDLRQAPTIRRGGLAEGPVRPHNQAMEEINGPPPTPADAALFDALYPELKQLAAGYMRRQSRAHTLQPTALVNELYLKLSRSSKVPPTSREHFLAVAAVSMRNILVDHARRKHRAKRSAPGERVPLEVVEVLFDDRAIDLLDLVEALDGLAQVDARAHRVLELRFFGGLTMDGIASYLDTPKRTVERAWAFANAWLRDALRPTASGS